MIKIDNVSYSYPKGGGVSNINLNIDDGEFVFMIGPTGSGKTTILRLIYMDLFPKAGLISIDKFDSQSIKKRKIPFLRRKIGVIFQNYHLLEDRNLFENIALPLHVLGYPRHPHSVLSCTTRRGGECKSRKSENRRNLPPYPLGF